MNKKLITLFNKALIVKNPTMDMFKKVNELAVKCGYIIPMECCSNDVFNWLKETEFNPNSTFYKTWTDITSKTRLELYIDQLFHYLTTYGTDFNLGNGYTQNSDPQIVEYQTFKVIKPATIDDIFNDCMSMFESGIAMNSETINLLIDFCKENNLISKIDVDKIKNKEAQVIICNILGKLPTDEFGILRSLIYSATNSSMLIKSKEMITRIKNSKECYTKLIISLNGNQLVRLSRIFYRYKPLFLAMKNSNTNTIINKIRKLAKKNHTPLKVGFWESCFINRSGNLNKAKESVDTLTNFKKVQLMQGILERINGNNIDGKMFIIRNGKMFVREGYKAKTDTKYLMSLYSILETSLVESISKKAKIEEPIFEGENQTLLGSRFRTTTIKLPKGIHLTVPSSEKNFVGNYPLGSYISMSDKNNIIGVYWRNEWGCRDYDLHYISDNGNHFGWNSSYTNDSNNVIYSGDMTNAEPEATELFYIENTAPNGVISLNKFNGDENSKFKFFIANENIRNKLPKRFIRRGQGSVMCDPNNIIFETELTHDSYSEQQIAQVIDNKIIISNLSNGNRRVSNSNRNNIIQEQFKVKSNSYVELEDILVKAGFEFVEENADIDLSQLSKNDLISLIA